jgi:hypothetical protein
MAEAMSGYQRELIERVRKVQKLLSLYVLALRDDTALEANDRQKLARTLRAVANVVGE